MAALTVALNVLQGLRSFLQTQAAEEVGMMWNFNEDLEEMEKTLVMLEAVLHDAEMRSIKEKAVSVWYAELRDVCYDIQDMLDPYLLQNRQQLPSETTYPNSIWSKFLCKNCLPVLDLVKVCFHNWFTRIVLAHGMRNIRNKLNNIAERKALFNLQENMVLDLKNINKDRETFSALEPDILGREEDQREIVNLILNNQNSDHFFVIPILGMGGIGKTTLAKLIFNDERLRDKNIFDLWAWAYVSTEFDLVNIGRRLIESLKGSNCDMQNLQIISQELQKEVSGKRFLIVLDDVWNIDLNNDWRKLESLLMGSSKRCTIVVTTRIRKTAQEIATNGPYDLKTLPNETCIQLFQKRAFKSIDEMKNYSNLVEIGNEIVRKCGGVALVANTLGCMLYSQRDEKHWLRVKNSEISELHDENLLMLSNSEKKILSFLKLSYNCMPAHLKVCFAYCSMFPKGHKIMIKKLVKHWVFLKFIRPTQDTTLTLEDIAYDYLNNLISLSLLQKCEVTIDEYLKKEEEIVMHDLVHDLARLVATVHDIKVFTDKENTQGANTISYRYVSLCALKKQFEFSKLVRQQGKVKALYFNNNQVTISDESFSQLTSLRVLEVDGRMTNLPKSVVKLKQLYYFSAFRFNQIRDLAELLKHLTSIKHLTILRSFFKLSSNSISEIIAFANVATLETNLTLDVKEEYIVQEEGILQCCNIVVLRNLNMLEGILAIGNLQRVKDPKDAEKANMKEKHKLLGLYLYWNEDELGDKDVDAAVFQNLQPSSSKFTTLEVDGYRGSEWPVWMMDNRYKLEFLELVNIENIELLLQPIGRLQHLKLLALKKMAKLSKINRELFGGNQVALFPSLTELRIADMDNLEEVCLTMFPHLKELSLQNCPCLRSVKTEHPSSIECVTLFKFATVPDLEELSALKMLEICDCPKLESLPDYIKQHAHRQMLYILEPSQALKEEVESSFPWPSIINYNEDGEIIVHIKRMPQK